MMSNRAVANVWDSPDAKEIAEKIASLSGLYCGPAVVGWIAAVWNSHKGRPYDYMTRLKNKELFSDGPVPFRFHLPGIHATLSELLQRETNQELKLSEDTYYRYSAVHDSLHQFEMPVVVRMLAPRLRDGLHYVTAYKSERKLSGDDTGWIRLYCQDNGLTTSNSQSDDDRNGQKQVVVRTSGIVLGAKRVLEV